MLYCDILCYLYFWGYVDEHLNSVLHNFSTSISVLLEISPPYGFRRVGCQISYHLFLLVPSIKEVSEKKKKRL